MLFNTGYARCERQKNDCEEISRFDRAIARLAFYKYIPRKV